KQCTPSRTQQLAFKVRHFDIACRPTQAAHGSVTFGLFRPSAGPTSASTSSQAIDKSLCVLRH
ncbi:MAG: hypothetical protein AAF722_00325, partial [Cyanobacteria bacterium P01_C01_bin.70]